MSKHGKAKWLKAAYKLRDRYTEVAFNNLDIRRGYKHPRYCSFCLLVDPTCAGCIYYLAQREGLLLRKEGGTLGCNAVGPTISQPNSCYKTVARRRTWLEDDFIPWLKSLPAKHEFFTEEKP